MTPDDTLTAVALLFIATLFASMARNIQASECGQVGGHWEPSFVWGRCER